MDAQITKVPSTISASRLPAMLGMDSRTSPMTLYLRLSGQMHEEDLDANVAIQQGRFYERATAEWACSVYGMQLVEGFEQKNLVSGNLSGHPDFLAIDEHGKLVILEVKNPFWSYGGDDWGESGTDEVPKPHFIQTTAYGHLFREWAKDNPLEKETWAAEIADYTYVIAKLAGGVQRFKVPIDDGIVKTLQDEAGAFIKRIADGDMPSPQDEQDMRNRWPVDEAKVAKCDESFVETLKTLVSVRDQMKALKKQESELKTVILAFAEDAAKIECNGTTVATLNANRSFDADACLAAHPELLAKGFAKLDVSKLAKEQKALHEMFMRKPETAIAQTRVIKVKLPKEPK